MANYRAVATGNWSSLAIWEDDGSGSWAASTTLPGVDDDVYANFFEVLIDQTISVKSLRNQSATDINADGRFKMTSSYDITTVDGIYGSNSSNIEDMCLLIGASITINIYSDVYGGVNGKSQCIHNEYDCTISIYGDVGVLYDNYNDYSYAIYNTGDCDITIIGNVGLNQPSNSMSIYNEGDCNFTIIGNITGLYNRNGYGTIYDNNTSSNYYITGNLKSGNKSYSTALRLVSNTGIVEIIGNVYGSTYTHSSYGTNSIGLYITASSTEVNITGNIYTGIYSPGVYVEGTGTINITGNLYSDGGINYSAVRMYFTGTPNRITGNLYSGSLQSALSGNGGAVIIKGNVYNYNSIMAIFYLSIYYDIEPDTQWEFYNYASAAKSLVAENSVTGMPSEADVRKDVVYGAVSGLTGTCIIPPVDSVMKNVPVDNTVGTMEIKIPSFGPTRIPNEIIKEKDGTWSYKSE